MLFRQMTMHLSWGVFGDVPCVAGVYIVSSSLVQNKFLYNHATASDGLAGLKKIVPKLSASA